MNGYGIQTNYEGVYRGEFKNDRRSGYGLMKYGDGDEYDGQCEYDIKLGEGVY